MKKHLAPAALLFFLSLLLFLTACGPAPEAAPTALPQTPPSALTLTAPPTALPSPTMTVTPTVQPSQTPMTVPSPTPTSTPITIVSRVWEKDGMEQVFVPAGEFTMGHSDFGQYVHSVYLDAYWIDKTEITNAMFTQFVSETHYWTDSKKNGKGRIIENGVYKEIYGANWEHPQGLTSDLQGKDHWPVTQVSWNDAAAYCAWAGKRLPTNAEWEKAARGPDGRKYPWGNENSNCNLANMEIDGIPCIGGTTKVGSYLDGISPYGALDMVGNVWEWVYDWVDPKLALNIPRPTLINPINNPMGPYSGNYKMMRGDGWNTYFIELHLQPMEYANFYGFRCVSPEPAGH
ncbi:MAG TPA: SUMF1/EgtB/PvdO family nonheme iron enzyme [Anaerolineaceae bacterium]|nr:SUMF1/EgtB/PvdO family nonheme iron enzyme [Anaerolineaceae bacterium]HPN50759.1 SUMF1/EgtB/PvdO family nonheme iron enzyme [Anaerolineaceae bacterium]